MRVAVLLGIALTFGFAVPLSAEDKTPQKDAQDELTLLEGAWKVVALEADGKKAPAEALKGMSWSFQGAELRMGDPGDKAENKASVKLDPSRTPKRIDMVGLTGTDKGKTVEGIYKIENEQLVVCLGETKKERPTKFATTAGSDQGMITLERVKK